MHKHVNLLHEVKMVCNNSLLCLSIVTGSQSQSKGTNPMTQLQEGTLKEITNDVGLGLNCSKFTLIIFTLLPSGVSVGERTFRCVVLSARLGVSLTTGQWKTRALVHEWRGGYVVEASYLQWSGSRAIGSLTLPLTLQHPSINSLTDALLRVILFPFTYIINLYCNKQMVFVVWVLLFWCVYGHLGGS